MFFGQLDTTIPDLMESRNLVTAREMVQEGNWWHTTMNLEPRHEKPPLPTWMTALTARVGGGFDNLYLLRLPSAFMGVLMVLFFYGFCYQFTKSKNIALIAGAVMATNFMVVDLARINTWDIYTHAFMVGTLWAFLEGLERKHWGFHCLSAILFAMSFMSKGPVSLYTVWLPFLIIYVIVGKRWKLNPTLWKPIIFITTVGLLLGSYWYLSMYLTDQEVAEAIIEKELDGWSNRHPRPIYFYLHFPIFMGIWMIPFLSYIFPKYVRSKIYDQFPYKQILLWFALTLVLLSIIPTKKERYLLPMMIPSSLAVASMIYYLYKSIKFGSSTKFDRFLFYSVPIVVSFACIVITTFFFFFEEKSFEFNFLFSWILLVLLSIVVIYSVLKGMAKYSYILTFLTIGLFCFGLFAKSQLLIKGSPNLNSLTNVQKKIDLNGIKCFALQKDLDPRMIWLLGKNVYASENISFKNKNNFPLVYLSFVPIENLLSKEILNNVKVNFYGKYDIRPQKSEWQAHVYKFTWTGN